MSAATKITNKTDTARNRITTWMAEAKASFPERSDVIDGLVLCAIARTNIILYGPPGTAKSLLARAFAAAIEGRVFDCLFTRTTTVNEVNGPVDVQALKEGRMSRVIDGFLPTAHVAFLDEGFKSNSALLNALLTAVNEHAYHDNGKKIDIPLRCAVLASNEFPSDNDNLSAFDDRFPMRFVVDRFNDYGSFEAMITETLPTVSAKFSIEDLEEMEAASKAVKLEPSAIDALWGIRAKMSEKGVYVSDRKLHNAAKLLKVEAAMKGNPVVTTAHLGILEHILWLRPDKKALVREIVRDHVAEWIKDLRTAIEIIEEQASALQKATRAKTSSRDLATAVGTIVDRLDEVRADILSRLKNIDEAKHDAKALDDRITQLKANAQKALVASLGA